MDYLCELPNDAARRRALYTLPRGLVPTYKRILYQIKESSDETHTMVQRALQWIARGPEGGLTTKQLCEAVSINPGDDRSNPEAVPDHEEILRHCRSLVRLSADEEKFEFAHFSVQEFLESLDKAGNEEFAAFRICPENMHTQFFQTCLTYLNFKNFDQDDDRNSKVVRDRIEGHPFRLYAANAWTILASKVDWSDDALFSLAQRLLHPLKPGTLISWAQDFLIRYAHSGVEYPETDLLMLYGISEATALHYAAMFGLSKICRWLVESGCDVNRNSSFGTPLTCAQMSYAAISGICSDVLRDIDRDISTQQRETIDIILYAGANPNVKYLGLQSRCSPLFLATKQHDLQTVKHLIDNSVTVDDEYLNLVVKYCADDNSAEELQYVLQYAKVKKWGDEAYAEA